jgi:hypothetical protein
MKKLALLGMFALAPFALVGCEESPAEQRADMVEDAAENQADAVEAQGDMQADAVDDATENQADVIRAEGEAQADAIEETGDADTVIVNP